MRGHMQNEGEGAGVGIEFLDIDKKSRETLIKSLKAQKG
jgi:hypothetical protein